ncbi:hypothetical protein GIW81_08410 [Hyphomicrobium sp. xq]|uniref:Uncharacterized protein n=1 Tax=Hyphomicrobium album TaxID=2665159 RepID=A0A6I3KFJ3_9HYPH|nr:hypothetical protein [Hyphomicrobium album]MTD94355.1 hypothetical protein [Hyphomicrobium album]
MKRPRNPLRRSAKLDLVRTIQAVDLFAQGIGVNIAAKATGTSRKTMRGLYIDFRDRLSDPVFARWHRANAALLNVTAAEEIALIKSAMLELLAQCHALDTCYRNYRAGRRSSPICRACPLHRKFTSPETDGEAAALINSLRAFYHALNIHAEEGRDPVSLLRARLIHMVTIAAVTQNSRRLAGGRLDPKQKTFLSFGTFREVLARHLLESDQSEF